MIEWTSRRAEGKKAQEKVACDLEQYFPSEKIIIHSFDCYGEDLLITNNDNLFITGEVKSALELYIQKHKEKRIVRRGSFCINERDLRADFYCFVIKFVDIPGIWNGEYETFYAHKKDVESFVTPRLNKYGDYHLHISHLPKINATLDFQSLRIHNGKNGKHSKISIRDEN